MILKKITQMSIFLILIFIVGCVYKNHEIDRSNYSFDEIYEMLCIPLSNASKIIAPSISGRVTSYDFQSRGLGESEAKRILNYLKMKGIVDADGRISDDIDLGPNTSIELDKNNSDIQSILKVLENNRPKGPGFNIESSIEELAYRHLESLVHVVLGDLHPKYSTKSGYSYFMEELGGQKIELGTRYTEAHEYRFKDNEMITDGIRYFRDKNDTVKIICTYDIHSKYSIENELGGVFSETSGDVVVDKLTKTEGYIVFLVKRDYPEDLLEKEYYLMMARKGAMDFTAFISRSLFTQVELERIDSSIQRGPDVWEKHLSAEPAGKYLPGSGPGEGVRPGSGEVKAPYNSGEVLNE